MCVGPQRLYEAMATLSFDYKIKTPIAKTIIITPYTRTEVENALIEFGIDYSKFVVLNDNYFDDLYDLSRWSHDNWYKQQALKLCALDTFSAEQFLIQDADVMLLEDYEAFINSEPNFKAEDLWNEHHAVYAAGVEGIIGLKRGLNYSLVNEILPYYKSDWLELKYYIQQRHNKGWLDAIADHKPFDDTKWFSEYELLGIWKTNRGGWKYFTRVGQPPITSWDDVYSTNWKELSAVKYHTRPLKFMDKQQAIELVRFINDTIN